jgi:hypothetical protein
MFNIGKYARGLPSILTLRERGSGPRTFAEEVQGTMDLTPLYLLENRETLDFGPTGALIVSANSLTVPVFVPPGELWYVWHYEAICAPGAGAAASVAPGVIFDGTVGIALGPYVDAAATGDVRAPSYGPFWAAAGSQIVVLCRSVTLAPTAKAAGVFTRLKV